jgi:hypothetical protein
VQGTELAAARGADYTLPELVDAPALHYQELAGEAEVLPGVTVLPTPGHTAGHQSLVVRQGDGTVVVLAGQSHDTATAFSADVLAWRARRDGHGEPLPVHPGGSTGCSSSTRHAWCSRTTMLSGSRAERSGAVAAGEHARDGGLDVRYVVGSNGTVASPALISSSISVHASSTPCAPRSTSRPITCR